MKDKIITLLKWLVILVIILVLVHQCDKIVDRKGSIRPKSDTLYIHHRDTIFSPNDTIYKLKEQRIVSYVHDTIVKPIYVSVQECNNVKLYMDTLSDKNLTIFDSIWVQGIIRDKKTSYCLDVPLIIYDSTKAIVHVPKLYPPNYQLQIGAIAGYNILAPTITLGIRRHNVDVGYNLQTKQPIVGYRFTIFRR